VKAPKFSYLRASDVGEVVELMGRYGEEARILAGGQSLMPTLNMRLSRPALLIDINRVAGLGGISVVDGHVRIGALTRHAELANSKLVAEHLPLIAEAMPHVAHVAVRNRGTFGGSIALADPAAELPACALALGARFVLQSVRGRREVAAEDFFLGLYETARRPDELLLEALIPIERGPVSVFLELARRHGDFAIAGLAFLITIENGILADGRLVYFASEDRPILATAALAASKGKPMPAAAEACVAALADDLEPIGNWQASASMRRHLQRVLTRRALALAGERAARRARAV
jgi:carbon-monoxide dehydrogenase medium subunit